MSQLFRRAVIAGLVCGPLVTLWNIGVGPLSSQFHLSIGPKLAGVTNPVGWPSSWQAVLDQSWQKDVSRLMGEDSPFSPILIRLNNQLRYGLFGYISTPGIVRGRNGQLVEEAYLREYCSRSLADAAQRADRFIPLLLDLQKYYQSRNKVFLYVIAPSKVAQQPEDFVPLTDCPASERDRTDFLKVFVGKLQTAGVAVIDAASLIHAQRDSFDVPLFPQGGVHWNALGAALAARAIIADANRRAGHVLIPDFTFSYTVSKAPVGVDRDLADLMNVLFPPLAYRTANATFHPSVACDANPARTLNAVIVGDSFADVLSEVLTSAGCMSGLKNYRYLRLSRFRNSEDGLSPAGLEPLRQADLAILEQNEAWVGGGGFPKEFQMLLDGK